MRPALDKRIPLLTVRRSGGRTLTITRDTFKGQPYVRLQEWAVGVPVSRGVTIRIAELRAVVDALSTEQAGRGFTPSSQAPL